MYFAARIDVDHAVLDVCKITFDRFMDIFGDSMRFQQSQVIIGAYFHIDIDAAAEFAGLQHVDVINAFLRLDQGRHSVDRRFVAGAVDHFIDGVFKNFVGGVNDHQADDDAGKGVQHRVTHAGAQDTDEAADGREGVAAVVPGVGHQGAGVDLERCFFSIPEHTFFNDNGNNSGGQCQTAGDFEISGGGMEYFFQPGIAYAQAGEGQDDGQNDSGDTFQPFVSVLVLGIGGFVGDLDAGHNDEGAENVGGGVDSIGDHGSRIGQDACGQFADGKDEIDDDAVDGDLHGQTFGLGNFILHGG